MERKASRGEWHGGKLPYGDTRQTNARQVHNESPVVRQIFHLCFDGKPGPKSIAMRLNEQSRATVLAACGEHQRMPDIAPRNIFAYSSR